MGESWSAMEACKKKMPMEADSRILRRHILPLLLSPMGMLVGGNAQASKLGPAVDGLWEGIGGGPADLFFPEAFKGTWDVASSLVNVETPLGPEFVPDMKVINRSRSELNKPTRYSVRFFRAPGDKLITDRRYNTASLLEMYYGPDSPIGDTIQWNPADPNILQLRLPGGTSIYTRVTRRSANRVSQDRFETSEFYEQVFDSDSTPSPKVTASQCFTKYKWRSEEAARDDGGPSIVATQVVSDYLTTSSGEERMMQAMGKAVDILTYRMAFVRRPDNVISSA